MQHTRLDALARLLASLSNPRPDGPNPPTYQSWIPPPVLQESTSHVSSPSSKTPNSSKIFLFRQPSAHGLLVQH